MTEKKEATKKTAAANSGLEASTEFSNQLDKNENVKLSKEEKLAVEIQQTAGEGESYTGKFKLKDPGTSYQDKDFTLALDQEKELPENPSRELLARIRSGFIVKA